LKVSLIHAMTASVRPIEQAFQEMAPGVTLLHFMDTGLLPLLQESGGELSPAVTRRFSRLVNLAAESDADVIQLTCSAFNDITKLLQPFHAAKLFRSDEAMLDQALGYERVGLVSTVMETPNVLSNYLKEKTPNIHIESLVNTKAVHFLNEGNIKAHDDLVLDMIQSIDGKVDVIVLSQYSMAHVAQQAKTTVPILTGPKATASRCLEYMER
jgi:Asp/Glu/hydantoin racemase